MQVSVEKVSNVERRLTIVVPANQVEEAYAKQIDEYAKKANLKGFRPGKAPRSHIEVSVTIKENPAPAEKIIPGIS